MARESRASVQYGDMRGTIAIDGWDGISALSFGGAGKGYWPVGIELYGEPDRKGAKMDWYVHVLAVDVDLLDGRNAWGSSRWASELA